MKKANDKKQQTLACAPDLGALRTSPLVLHEEIQPQGSLWAPAKSGCAAMVILDEGGGLELSLLM